VEQFVLKEKLKEMIGNRQVLAALFYTFNFDPRFFENYVMPLFVPGKDFRDEVIHNKILWRNCLKEGIVPPVTVYCDYFVKDNTEAPSLGYEIYCIKMPAAKGSICNFHPKHIFILVKDDKGNESMILVTGSGNLGPSGWCENFECFSIEEITSNKTVPNKTTTNIVQNIISWTGGLVRPGNLTEAETLIDNYLRYVDFNKPYFNSLNQSFRDFLNEQVFIKDSVTEVEIASPYFSNDISLIEYLKTEKNIKKIKCLIPTLRNNEIQLNKETFIKFSEAGINWCFWEKYIQNDKVQNRNTEVRKLHAKIYRFHGEFKTYTIIGSVNFTNPAWTGYTNRNNKANIESAWLYVDNGTGQRLLKSAGELNPDHFRFKEMEDPENTNAGTFANREVPDIDFTINWKTKELTVKAKLDPTGCSFKNILRDEALKHGTHEIELSPADLRILTSNTLIEVSQKLKKETVIRVYYPRQLNIEMKPLDFKLSATNILRYWDFLEDDYSRELLTRNLAERTTDESGVVDEENIERKSLLNEMAAHFSGLVKLEKYLFPDYIQNKSERREKFRQLKYYLLSENIDTLSFYIEDLKNQSSQSKIQKSFFWMIIQIVLANFYIKAAKWMYRHDIVKEEWKPFKNDIALKNYDLRKLVKEVAREINCPDIKLRWVEEQLARNYESD
jgi:PLD-like domain